MSRWQFGLAGLMQVVVGVALVLALFRVFWIFGLIWLMVVGTIGWLIWFVNPGNPRGLFLLKWLAGYFLLGTVTLPFVNQWWVGEFPILVLCQWPQIPLAEWVRQRLVWNLVLLPGLGRGSSSPAHPAASPLALILTCLGTLAIVIGPIAVRTRLRSPYGIWALILTGLTALDFLAIHWFYY